MLTAKFNELSQILKTWNYSQLLKIEAAVLLVYATLADQNQSLSYLSHNHMVQFKVTDWYLTKLRNILPPWISQGQMLSYCGGYTSDVTNT